MLEEIKNIVIASVALMIVCSTDLIAMYDEQYQILEESQLFAVIDDISYATILDDYNLNDDFQSTQEKFKTIDSIDKLQVELLLKRSELESEPIAALSEICPSLDACFSILHNLLYLLLCKQRIGSYHLSNEEHIHLHYLLKARQKTYYGILNLTENQKLVMVQEALRKTEDLIMWLQQHEERK